MNTILDSILTILTKKFAPHTVKIEWQPEENVIGIAVFNVPMEKEADIYDAIYEIEDFFFSDSDISLVALVRDEEMTAAYFPEFASAWSFSEHVSRNTSASEIRNTSYAFPRQWVSFECKSPQKWETRAQSQTIHGDFLLLAA